MYEAMGQSMYTNNLQNNARLIHQPIAILIFKIFNITYLKYHFNIQLVKVNNLNLCRGVSYQEKKLNINFLSGKFFQVPRPYKIPK